MLWKKKIKISEPLKFESETNELREDFPYPERYCWLYISEKFNEILFVPMGKIDDWKSRELDSVIVKDWPINIGELQKCILEALDKWQDPVPDTKPNNENWHSLNNSKAKTQRSYVVDYVHVRLTTDMKRKYGQGEVERITVEAAPKDWTEDSYNLMGCNHLSETQVAQVVLDIHKACEKIRTN
jgi:hypothetical protein